MKGSCTEGTKFPLSDIQSAYIVGEQDALPLATTAKYYREVDLRRTEASVLESAWNILLKRHPMLRAVACDDGTQQLVACDRFILDWEELDHLSPKERLHRYDSIKRYMLGKRLPVNSFPQFSLLATYSEDKTRIHVCVNLWILDAVSMQTIFAELSILCNDLSTRLDAVRGTYREYIDLRTAGVASLHRENARDYWCSRIGYLPGAPELPLRDPAVDIKRPEFSHRGCTVPSGQWSLISANAFALGVSPAMSVFSSYLVTLGRWSKTKHFTVTVLVSARPLCGLATEGVVGNFSSTILIEVDLSSKAPFIDIAKAIQRQFWKDMRHWSVSGVEVARDINRAQGTPGALVSPVTFTSLMSGWSNSGETEAELNNIDHVTSALQVPQVYLDCQVIEEPGGELVLNWDYVPEAFQEGVVEEMFDGFVQILLYLTAQENWLRPPARDLPHLQKFLYKEYNNTNGPLDSRRLDELVDEQIRLRPDKVAIEEGELEFTYGQLGEGGSSVYNALKLKGIGSGDLVAVILPKGAEQVQSVLGILRAGAAYVPVDPGLPAARRTQILTEAAVSAAICPENLVQAVRVLPDVKVLSTDDIRSCQALAHWEHLELGNEETAYVIYTSGSTGTPKGVVIDHQGAVNTIRDIVERLAIGPEDKCLALSSLSFDLSVFDIFGILGAGGTLVIPTEAEAEAPEQWCRLVVDRNITIWNSVPALFQLVVEFASSYGQVLSSIRRVMLSGDWIPLALPRIGVDVAKNAEIYSLGGATEASIWSVIHKVDSIDTSWRSIPYGRPMANQRLYILDDELHKCPVWVVGEIFIAGVGLAKGYLNDPARTSERFITHPHTNELLYRTGDLGRMQPCGLIEFLGREDQQVKIRGYRIELGDVEAALLTINRIKSALARTFGSSSADKALVAFVILHSGRADDGAEIKRRLIDLLPHYMVPSFVHVLDEFPLTPNGKVDNRALESIYACSVPTLTQRKVPNRERGEAPGAVAAIQRVWADVLGRPVRGTDGTFSNLGGTSFQAIQLVGALRSTLGLKLDLREVLSGLSIDDLVRRTRSGLEEAGSVKAITQLRMHHGERDASVFCVHPVGGSSQCYLELAKHISPGAAVYGIQDTWSPSVGREDWTIEEIAEVYTESIIEADVIDPVVLVGWSFGGAVAQEISRRLSAAGREVALCCMIDPFIGNSAHCGEFTVKEALLLFGRDLAGISGIRLSKETEAKLEAAEGSDPEGLVELLIQELEGDEILPSDCPVEEVARIFNVFVKNMRSLSKYQGSYWGGRTRIFLAETELYAADGILRRWLPPDANVKPERLCADHFSIIGGEHVRHIAHAINESFLCLSISE